MPEFSIGAGTLPPARLERDLTLTRILERLTDQTENNQKDRSGRVAASALWCGRRWRDHRSANRWNITRQS